MGEDTQGTPSGTVPAAPRTGSQGSCRINREVLDADRLAEELADDPRRHLVLDGPLRHLLGVRRAHPAFSPFGTQRVEALDDRVFALHRAVGTPEELLCVTNVTGQTVTLDAVRGHVVLTDQPVEPLVLGPWGYAWLQDVIRTEPSVAPSG